MSSAATPEDAPTEASPGPVSDGGTSKGLTQGEIIFATVLSFVVFLVVTVGAYAFYRQHKRKAIEQKEADERHRTDMTIDCEMGEMDNLHGGDKGSNNNAKRDNLHHQQSDRRSRRGSRRGSMDSNGSGGNKSGSHSRRATVDGMDNINRPSDRHRRATMGSMGSDVSSQYKQAAIEHMNQISQTGRHG